LQTAGAARVIAAQEGLDQTTLDDAFLAGMLHDIGKLVLAQSMPEPYAEVMRHVGTGYVATAEQEVLLTTHADVGAYLLGLWGLTDAVVEAVAFHEHPGMAPTETLGLPAIIHAADRLARFPDQTDPCSEQLQLDRRCLEHLGMAERWPTWQSAWARHLAGGEK
jgi:HD-like signal output (HDOD) protein